MGLTNRDGWYMVGLREGLWLALGTECFWFNSSQVVDNTPDSYVLLR